MKVEFSTSLTAEELMAKILPHLALPIGQARNAIYYVLRLIIQEKY
jgi:hypothetical protein